MGKKNKIVEVFKKIFGAKEPSESRADREWTIFHDGDGFTCDCEDFTFRNGSYDIKYKDGNDKAFTQRGCKHIAKHLKNFGFEVEVRKDGVVVE